MRRQELSGMHESLGKCVVLFSGGLDSSVLLYWARAHGYRPAALSIYYRQRHSRELEHAADIAGRLGVEHVEVDLSALSHIFTGSGSSQVDGVTVPHGHWTEESMKLTVVPNR